MHGLMWGTCHQDAMGGPSGLLFPKLLDGAAEMASYHGTMWGRSWWCTVKLHNRSARLQCSSRRKAAHAAHHTIPCSIGIAHCSRWGLHHRNASVQGYILRPGAGKCLTPKVCAAIHRQPPGGQSSCTSAADSLT